MTDVELLSQHQQGSESAFTDLVRRHIAWVYGLARRRLGDSHLAEDVAQAVFVLLHRKSPHFAADRALTSWLHKTACYASDSAARAERRRHGREIKVAMQRPEATEPAETPEWLELAPMLDDLIGRLSRADREAILLRFYRDLSFDEVAAQIGTTPDAARKRTERAVEKLRQMAAQKGSLLSTASLAAGLATFVRIPPPPGLIATATITATAPAGSAAAASTAGIVKGALTMMASTKVTIISVAAVGLIAVGGAVCGTVWMMSSSSADAPIALAPPPASTPSPQPGPATLTLTGKEVNVIVSQLPNGQRSITIVNPATPIPKLAPYSALRWHGQIPEVQVNNTWYALIAVNDLAVNEIMTSQKMDTQHRKHFAEDLVELMTKLGHAPGATANLEVRTLDADKKILMLKNVPLTKDNRYSLMNWPAPGQTSLFNAYRLKDSVPQIRENGTWYELRAIEGVPLEKLVEGGKAGYGTLRFRHSVANKILTSMAQGDTLLELRTLDTNEIVELTIRPPQ